MGNTTSKYAEKAKKYSKNTDTAAAAVFGKINPQALELEAAVIGACLIDKEAIEVVHKLQPHHFYAEANRAIFSTMLALKAQSKPIDILTVSEKMRQSGNSSLIQDGFLLMEITNRIASSANLEYHSRIIAQKYLMRRLTEIGMSMTKEAFEDTEDVFELINRYETQILTINDDFTGVQNIDFATQILHTLKKMEEDKPDESGVIGIPTGFSEIDKHGGMRPGELIIVAGRPGMGKSAFVTSLAKNITGLGHPSAFYSLEMGADEIIQRMIAADGDLSHDRVKNYASQNDLTKQVILDVAGKIANLNLFIEDTSGITLSEFCSDLRLKVKKKGVKVAIFDYLQIMSFVGEEFKLMDLNQKVGVVTKTLKNLAKELGIPIILLSQLSRAVETRGGSKRPQLSDLRESGNIEQDASRVYFLYRPEYYGITEDENGKSLKGICELICAKYRSGKTFTAELGFHGETVKFYNLVDDFSAFIPKNTPNNSNISGQKVANILTNPLYLQDDSGQENAMTKHRPKNDHDIPF